MTDEALSPSVERDPRVDPRPGDCVRNLKGELRVVKQRVDRKPLEYGCNRRVIYQRSGEQHNCYLSTWREWARNGEIVARGTDD